MGLERFIGIALMAGMVACAYTAPKIALRLCVFLLPCAYRVYVHWWGAVPLSVLLAVGMGVGYAGRRLRDPSKASIPYLGFLLAAIGLFAFALAHVKFAPSATLEEVQFFGESPTTTIRLFLVTNVACWCIYYVAASEIKTLRETRDILWVLLLSAGVQFISWFGSYYRHLPLPSFLVYIPDLSLRSGGFPGLNGDTELTCEYLFLMVALAVYQCWSSGPSGARWWISVAAAVAAMAMGVSTGQRGIVLMLAVYGAAFWGVVIRSRAITASSKLSLSLGLATMLAFFACIVMFTRFGLAERVSDTFEMAVSGGLSLDNIEDITQRHHSKAAPDVLEVGGIVGQGAFFFSHVRGSEMSYHCLYFNLIVNYGLLGLAFYLFFFQRMLRDAYRLARSHDHSEFMVGATITAVLLALLVDEIKITFMREPTTMVMYWLLFALIGVGARGFGQPPEALGGEGAGEAANTRLPLGPRGRGRRLRRPRPSAPYPSA